MKRPETVQALAELLEQEPSSLLFFTADWCPDCRFVYPFMAAIEADYPELTFIWLDRDRFMALAQQWAILGIPSFVVVENSREVARFVSKERKTEAEIRAFLSQWRKEHNK